MADRRPMVKDSVEVRAGRAGGNRLRCAAHLQPADRLRETVRNELGFHAFSGYNGGRSGPVGILHR